MAMSTPWSKGRVFFWARLACDAALLLNIAAILHPMLVGDDFQLLVRSWTWDRTRAALWLPHNEHSMPLGRLSTWLAVQLAVRPTNVPQLLALQGPLALLAAMVLVYLLVRRETGEPFPALLAMALFGVNTHYQTAVNWYSASFAVLALDMLLLGLLAAQRWRQTGHRRWLALSAFWCALAPGWFGSGVLAGPVCLLYLLASRPPAPRRAWLPALVPLLGTLASLAVTWPLNGERILSLPRVEVAATARATLDPAVGLRYTLRAIVDDLLPGALGFREVTSPPWVVVGAWVAFGAAGAWWWRQAPHRPLLVAGAALIVTGYLLIFTARAYFPYEGMHHWGRYHLLAHLGLALLVCGGLPRRFVARVNAAPVRRIDLGAACVLGALLLTQCPRALVVGYDARQYLDLRRLETVEERCRTHHIGAATARAALPGFEVSGMWDEEINGRRLSGWDLLRGSSEPWPTTVEEARRLLEGP
jgi:hypothetical protein